MNLVSWALFGMIVGMIVNTVDPAPNKGGLFGTLLVGVAGALVGGLAANLIFGSGLLHFDPISFFIAIAGSLAVLFGIKAVHHV